MTALTLCGLGPATAPPGDQRAEAAATGIAGPVAVNLATKDMRESVVFYEALGFKATLGGRRATVTIFDTGQGQLILMTPRHSDFGWGDHPNPPEDPGTSPYCQRAPTKCSQKTPQYWGRVIFEVPDVDAMYERALRAGYKPEFAPRNAVFGKRYFHVLDPSGNEVSFNGPLTVRSS